MGIFLRHSYNIEPTQWGSDADVMYAVRENCEKIYGIDSNRQALAMPFWERSGLGSRDFSKSQKNGVLTGPTIGWKDSGIEITGDGVSDKVNLGSITSSDLLGGAVNKQLSIVTRVYRTGNPPNNDYPRIIDKSNGSNGFNGWALHWSDVGAENRFYFVIANADGSIKSSNYGSLDATYDIVISAKESELKIYVNGVNDTIVIDQNFVWPTVTANLAIGNWNHTTDRQWNGKIFSMNVYDDFLTAPQAALFRDLPYGLYQKVSRPFYLLPTAPPVGWTGEIIGITNPTEILGRATSGISKVNGIPYEHEAFNVTDGGGEAFRVTDGGGENFEVIQE